MNTGRFDSQGMFQSHPKVKQSFFYRFKYGDSCRNDIDLILSLYVNSLYTEHVYITTTYRKNINIYIKFIAYILTNKNKQFALKSLIARIEAKLLAQTNAVNIKQ